MVILSWLTWSIQMQSRARQIFFITIILSPSTNLFHSIVRREWEGQFVIKMSILPELIISNHSKQAAPPTAVGNNSELTQSLQRLFILRYKMWNRRFKYSKHLLLIFSKQKKLWNELIYPPPRFLSDKNGFVVMLSFNNHHFFLFASFSRNIEFIHIL